MKISLLHPSRGRCEQALKTFNQWINESSGKNEIEYICSIDVDDPTLECYRDSFEDYLLISHNRSIVDAVNNAAQESTGEMLIVVSDDFDCPPNWDMELKKLINVLPPFGDPSKPNHDLNNYAILINDGIQTQTMTLPILSRSVYETLGHIYHPDYFSVFADNEITEVCEAMGVLIKAPDLVFLHRHYTVEGGLPRDATYDRENSAQAYAMGKKTFDLRKARKFDMVT